MRRILPPLPGQLAAAAGEERPLRRIVRRRDRRVVGGAGFPGPAETAQQIPRGWRARRGRRSGRSRSTAASPTAGPSSSATATALFSATTGPGSTAASSSSSAAIAAQFDLGTVAALYDQLAAVDPGPVVALNRAVAVAELDGPAVGLAAVDRLGLTAYHAWHATRADLLRRLGRSGEARAAYDAAIATTDNPAERAFLARRRGQLAG